MVLGDPSYVSYFKGFICDKTVTELEISGENIYSCCPSYFPLPVGTVEDALNDKGFLTYNLNQNYSNIVNSTTKKESKFQFCSMIDCPKIKNLEHGPKVDLNQAKPKLSEVRLSFDATCNLWCAYCRGGEIVANKAKQDEHQSLYKTLIKELLLRTDRVFLNGYGDVFASKICRQMLHDIKVETHPNLKVDIITNGILFNERTWKDFESCNYAFSKIRISIDAASEMTYKVNRLGGTWSILMKNLKFISALRKNNLIDDFSISMVVQENNYSEMCEFYNLGVNLGCDNVIFEELMDWNVLDKEIISKMIISNSNHPGFNDFKKEKTKLSNLVTETEVGKSFGEFPILSHSWSI